VLGDDCVMCYTGANDVAGVAGEAYIFLFGEKPL